MSSKRRVAVFFGGRSPEHDVSIVTALQVMSALDSSLYEVLPVYLEGNGTWWTGPELRERTFYLPGAAELGRLTQVTLDMTASGRPQLIGTSRSLFRKSAAIPFDVAIPSFHGLVGEDGQIQGTFEAAGVPYTGMRTLASAVLMDKAVTKRVLAGTGIPLLDYREIPRPREGLLITPEELEPMVGDLGGPWCIKPSHLGSSIGVARVTTLEELSDVLPEIFRYDTSAILEPFVENMVEYNIAVSRASGALLTSALEKPKRSEELLDFKEKYLSSGGKKTGGKAGGGKQAGAQSSQGMLSLTRELNPTLPHGAEEQVRRWSEAAFMAVAGTGAPRIDFIGNEKTGEIWLNEVNPCPGSFAYFLWEAMAEPILFSDLLDDLIREALELAAGSRLPADPTPKDARLFPRR
jgi:D-alanine-D-alanine ligase